MDTNEMIDAIVSCTEIIYQLEWSEEVDTIELKRRLEALTEEKIMELWNTIIPITLHTTTECLSTMKKVQSGMNQYEEMIDHHEDAHVAMDLIQAL